MMDRMIDSRHCGLCSIREQLEMTETALTVRNGNAHEQFHLLTGTDWTRGTFVDYIAQRNPDAEAATRGAGPLLYKMMIRYGSYPFPPDPAQHMTCGTFLRGIYMMSRMKNRLLWRQCGILGGEPASRERVPIDDIRIFFQSVASDSSQSLTLPTERSETDDEDLIDVLFILMDEIRGRQTPKFALRRRDVLPAVARLPSSLSANIDGAVKVNDLRLLLEPIATLLDTKLLGTMALSTSTAVDCIIGSFLHESPDSTFIRWDTFREVVLESFVRTRFQVA
jgi:hypothetical protein